MIFKYKIMKRSKKSIETEKYVDLYIRMNDGKPPTYKELEDKFSIKHTAAYNRCKDFRNKMCQHEQTETVIDHYLRKYKQVA